MTFKILNSNNKLKVTKGSVLLFFQFAIPPPGSGSASVHWESKTLVTLCKFTLGKLNKLAFIWNFLTFFSFYLKMFSPRTLADPDPQAWLFCMLTKVYFSQQDVPLRSSVVLGDHQQHQWVSTPDSGEYF